MRLFLLLLLCVCTYAIPMFWRKPCLEEFLLDDVQNKGISKNELVILLRLILFELEDIEFEFHDYIKNVTNFLHHTDTFVELELLHMTSFYITKSQQRLKMPTFKVNRISELIRILRCELLVQRPRPVPWRQLKLMIIDKDLSNGIYVDYLLFKFSNVIKELIDSLH